MKLSKNTIAFLMDPISKNVGFIWLVCFCFGPVTGEVNESMETSIETSTDPLETTKDKTNLGAQNISQNTGNFHTNHYNEPYLN